MSLRHVVCDVEDALPFWLDDPGVLVEIIAACERHGATVLRSLVHSFEPQGVTALVVLAESHAALSTWPELSRAYFDVFTCGEIDPLPIASDVCALLGGRVRAHLLCRDATVPPLDGEGTVWELIELG